MVNCRDIGPFQPFFVLTFFFFLFFFSSNDSLVTFVVSDNKNIDTATPLRTAILLIKILILKLLNEEVCVNLTNNNNNNKPYLAMFFIVCLQLTTIADMLADKFKALETESAETTHLSKKLVDDLANSAERIHELEERVSTVTKRIDDSVQI